MATVAVTFVVLSSLFIIVRQSLGGPLSKYDLMITRAYLQLGFMVAGGALLPPLLGLYALPQQVVWRVAGVIAAIPIFLFALTFPARRFAATGVRMPTVSWFYVSLTYAVALMLLLNTVGIPLPTGAALYATGVSILLFMSFHAFLFALGILLRQPSPPARGKDVYDQPGNSREA